MTDISAGLSGPLLVYSIYIVNAAPPGPSNMAIMGTSMEQGRLPGLILAAGVLAGSFTWAGLAALGVGSLVASFPGALVFLKVAGSLFLFWLAWRSARAAMRADVGDGTPHGGPPASARRLFVRGYLMHITNPGPILSWTAIMALGLGPGASPGELLPVFAGCLALGTAIFGGYALLFSTDRMVRGYRRWRRAVEGVLAGFFAYAGWRLLTQRF
jgi:threonine/homoserine/homoserine lactone efflux protein